MNDATSPVPFALSDPAPATPHDSSLIALHDPVAAALNDPARAAFPDSAGAALHQPVAVAHYSPMPFERCVEQAANPRPRRAPFECGNLPFLIKRDGTWLYQGTPILRKELVCLFASVLRRDAAGEWRLETPAERGRIQVEDAPFIAVELDWAGDGQTQKLSFRTNTDQVVTASPDHPIRVEHDADTDEPRPYILVRTGDGTHGIEARVNRAVYYELVALAVPEYVGTDLMLGVWSSGAFFPLGRMPDDDGEGEP